MKTLHLGILIGTALTMIILSHGSSAQDMGGPVEVAHYQISQILARGDDLYVTYQENPSSGVHGNIFFRSSIDGGRSFGKIIKINDKDEASEPNLAVSGNNIYVAWDSFTLGNNNKDVLLRMSTDGGNSFGNSQILDLGSQSGDAFLEQLVANGPNVYALMRYENATGNWDLILRSSNDYGKTFGKTLVLSEGGSWLMSKIITTGTHVYVSSEDARCNPMCRQSDIVLRRSVDNGSTFGNMINLSKGEDIANYHQMVVSGTNVYLAWQEGQFPDVLFTKSTDGGATFGNKTDLSENIGESESVHLVAQGKNVYVAFYHGDAPNRKSDHPPGIYFTKSTDGGSTFSNPTLMHGSNRSETFGLAVDANAVFFLYGQSDFFGNRETLLEKSTDNGTTFTFSLVVNKGLNWTSGFEGLAKGLAVSGNHVYATFASPMPVDLLYSSASSDGGETFGNAVALNQGQWVYMVSNNESGNLRLGGGCPCPVQQIYAGQDNSWLNLAGIGTIIGAASVTISVYVMRKK